MSIETGVIRAEPHSEIGALIEERADVLIDQWCYRAIEEQPSAKRVHAVVLRDHFATFLRAMGRALKQSGDSRQHRAVALEHGDQRWESGWSLTELVRDYQLLQLVILEFLEETLRRDLYYREMMAIGVFIDDAVASSIRSYVANRDDEIHRVERDRADALEQANRRKDEFMAILGHELRNPLPPIENSVKIIRSLLGPAPQGVLVSLDVIERQTRHLVRLVDDILDLARISQGQFELRKSHLELKKILEQAVQTCAPVIKARDHELTVSYPDSPVELDADPDRLVQIICNLLNNAAKYTEPGGRIRLVGERDGDSAVIRVSDNGVGIPPEMLSRVFDLFTQVEGSKQSSEGGMGIGLTLARRLVEQHGGTITCASAGAGQGSEFTVRLPAAGAAQAGAASAAPDADTPCGLRIVERPSVKPKPPTA